MNRPPAFQFYAKDWLDFKVQRMTLAAQGAYIKLLCFMWKDSKDQCSLLDDNDLLARAIGTTVEHWSVLRGELQHASEPLFEENNGRLISARLREEARKQRNYRKQQAIKGKLSAQQRGNRSSTTVEPKYQPEGNSSSSSSSSEKKDIRARRTDVLNGHRSGFELFWQHYPKKRNKGAAEKVWAKLQPDDVMVGTMLSKLDQAKQTNDWQKERGQFIPYPASWLNAKGWEDEYQPPRKERLPL